MTPPSPSFLCRNLEKGARPHQRHCPRLLPPATNFPFPLPSTRTPRDRRQNMGEPGAERGPSVGGYRGDFCTSVLGAGAARRTTSGRRHVGIADEESEALKNEDMKKIKKGPKGLPLGPSSSHATRPCWRKKEANDVPSLLSILLICSSTYFPPPFPRFCSRRGLLPLQQIRKAMPVGGRHGAGSPCFQVPGRRM